MSLGTERLSPLDVQQFLQVLEENLHAPKPGWDAQIRMAPEPRFGHKPYQDVDGRSMQAGVLILLYLWQQQWHVLFTQRTERVLHHRAQISFPGGQQEPGESLQQTALRETHEELGISPHSVQVLGELTPLYVPPSNYCIYPFVAFVPMRPEFHPAPKEVAAVIEIPLDFLLKPENRITELWTLSNRDVKVPFFSFHEHKIWGATAMILAEFLEVVSFANKKITS